jgi:translation initiation factor 4B
MHDHRPVDVSAKDKEVTERVEKEREAVASKVQHSMSRTSSKGGFERTTSRTGTPRSSVAANIRPAVSFASALNTKGDADPEASAPDGADPEIGGVTKKLAETSV